MIESIKFTGKFGYIINKHEKPEKPFNRNRCYYGMTKEESDAHYKKAMANYRKNKDKFINQQLATNLLDKEIKFSADKINIIFAPNGAGKSTVIKALAGNSLITDGFVKMLEPIKLGLSCFDEEYNENIVIKKRNKMMLNSADIVWDGTPIYYENFSEHMTQYHAIGDLQGSVISNIGEEINYIINRNKTSLGENSLFIFNKVMQIAKTMPTYDELFKNEINIINGKSYNDSWVNCYKMQLDYFKSFPNYAEKRPITILFDEMDKSLDITNVIYLYRDLLPLIQKKTNIQIITVSHSPVIMSNAIFNSPNYNIISLDQTYTEKCRNELKSLFR